MGLQVFGVAGGRPELYDPIVTLTASILHTLR